MISAGLMLRLKMMTSESTRPMMAAGMASAYASNHAVAKPATTASTRITAVLVTTSSTVRKRSRSGAVYAGWLYIWSSTSVLGAACCCALITAPMFRKAGLLLFSCTVTSDEVIERLTLCANLSEEDHRRVTGHGGLLP